MTEETFCACHFFVADPLTDCFIDLDCASLNSHSRDQMAPLPIRETEPYYTNEARKACKEINALRPRFNHAPFNRVGERACRRCSPSLPSLFRSYFLPASRKINHRPLPQRLSGAELIRAFTRGVFAQPRTESNAGLGNSCIRLRRV